MKYIFKKKIYIFLFSIIDFIGKIFFAPFKVFSKKGPGNVGNILVVRLDHIGDVISSLPVLENLKKHYIGAKITLLVGSWVRPVVMNNPFVDEVICYDAPWFDRHKRGFFSYFGFIKLAFGLQKHHYDLGFDLRGDFRNIALMWLGGVKFRVGYGITGGNFLLNLCQFYKFAEHTTELSLGLLNSLGIKIVTNKPKIYLSKEDKGVVDNFFKSECFNDNQVKIILHPYAGYSSKNWLDERYIELISRLEAELKAQVIVVGSFADKEKVDFLIKGSLSAVNSCGLIPVQGLAELINKAALFIGVDSGPSHIAAATDIPCLLLYSGTNVAAQWAPKRENIKVIQKDIPCKDCGKVDCESNICMDLISVDDVMEEVRELIAGEGLRKKD
ncbi:MAG: glycosyltransferase family 9 protein [Candidatus Omnitrophota bacterium]